MKGNSSRKAHPIQIIFKNYCEPHSSAVDSKIDLKISLIKFGSVKKWLKMSKIVNSKRREWSEGNQQKLMGIVTRKICLILWNYMIFACNQLIVAIKRNVSIIK